MSSTRKRSIKPEAPPKSTKKRKSSIHPGRAAVVVEEAGIQEAGAVVLVCGDGSTGQLGLGEDDTDKARPVMVPGLTDMVDVIAGGMHTICVKKDRTRLVTFGCNDEGALGRDTSEPGTEFVPGEVVMPGRVAQVTAGDSHSAALLTDGSVYVWGVFRDEHGPMGLLEANKVEKTPVALRLDTRVTRIASGVHHLSLLTADGQVLTMGCAEQGQLGRVSERLADRSSRRNIDTLLKPSSIGLRKKFCDVWAGGYCTLAREAATNRIFAFGLNNYKQLGLDGDVCFKPYISDTFSNLSWKKLCVGMHHLIGLTEDGKVFSAGRKEYGRLGLGEGCEDAAEPKPVTMEDQGGLTDVSCGTSASFTISHKRGLLSWGMASSQLGQGDTDDDLWTPKPVTGATINKHLPLKVSAGGQHLVILAKPRQA